MKKYDYIRVHGATEKATPPRYHVVEMKRQDPPLAKCMDRDIAQMIVDALNHSAA